MPTGKDEIEELAALILAPLVEIAWADGGITEGERQGVLEAAKRLGVDQQSEFCRSTLRRWLYEAPPVEVFDEWRRVLATRLSQSDARIARKGERRLVEEVRRIAKMDVRPFDADGSLDARAGIPDAEQRVLDDLERALGEVSPRG